MSSKKFTDLNAGTIGAGSIFAQAQEPALSGDPYTSTKVSATQIANYVAKGQAFPELNNQTLIQALTGGSGAGTVILTMAQYIALTPAQQTDGHIYVISDFACLFCYGRQYRALQELERAQYDQLSPAELNNGTLYIITDEETTAADIPYSAGVSVADKLDSLSDINKGTRTFVGILGKQVNSYYRLGFNLPQAKAESITVNSVIKTGDPTELKSLFTLANFSSNGYFQLYSNNSSLTEGAYYEVNVTIS